MSKIELEFEYFKKEMELLKEEFFEFKKEVVKRFDKSAESRQKFEIEFNTKISELQSEMYRSERDMQRWFLGLLLALIVSIIVQLMK